MKILKWASRIAIILVVAAVVVGLAGVVAPQLTLPDGGRGENRGFVRNPQEIDNRQASTLGDGEFRQEPAFGRRGEGRGESNDFNVAGISVLGKNLAEISLIVLPFAVFATVQRNRKRVLIAKSR